VAPIATEGLADAGGAAAELGAGLQPHRDGVRDRAAGLARRAARVLRELQAAS
jgi:hypothetical protein